MYRRSLCSRITPFTFNDHGTAWTGARTAAAIHASFEANNSIPEPFALNPRCGRVIIESASPVEYQFVFGCGGVATRACAAVLAYRSTSLPKPHALVSGRNSPISPTASC